MHLRKRRQHPDQAIFRRISCRKHCEPRPCTTRYLTGGEFNEWAGGAGLWEEGNHAGKQREGGKEGERGSDSCCALDVDYI